ncbi:hypothetical protein BRC86_07325 [Halobacteriales archaeon QS_3_64_16]|nr:MAG: hypothetical protein BRC86_07325 [Halobacteriales archaeon QS_3_64_16]
MVVLGMTAVIGFGSQALDATEERSEFANAEQAMAQFDSKAAQVALGGSAVQSTTFGQTDGGYRVNGSKGWLRVDHFDHSGNNNTEVIANKTLGTVAYSNTGTEIAYQGGGVWRKDPAGEARMISPPEFHYRDATLTLPIVSVNGTDSAGGATTAVVDGSQDIPLYPNRSASYGFDGDPYDNPVDNGTVSVTVHSEYSAGWAEYFRTRTDGCVVTSDDTTTQVKNRCNIDDLSDFGIDIPSQDNTVSVYLLTPGTRGPFPMPGEGSAVDVRGLSGGHTLSEFNVTLRPDDTDSADFANLQWSMYAESGARQFEIHLRRQSGNDCSDTKVGVTVYYSGDGGETYQGWFGNRSYTTECFDSDGDGDDEAKLTADFVDDSDSDGNTTETDGTDPELNYTSLASSDLQHFNPSGAELLSSATIDEHAGSVGWESETYSSGSTEVIDRLLRHYLALMGPGIDLTVDDKNSDTISEDASSGVIRYPISGQYISFLHVTYDGIDVRLE